jgi:hypothetical protein
MRGFIKKENKATRISKKLSLRDAVKYKNEYINVKVFIETNPLLLWSLVREKGNRVYLNSETYNELKRAVFKLKPSLIEDSRNTKELFMENARKKKQKEALLSAIQKDDIDKEGSRFRKILL